MADSITLPAEPIAAPFHPYPPSWVDRLIDWIERRPGRPWAFYAVLAVALVSLEVAIKFADGTYPDRFHPWHVVMLLTSIYYLAVNHWLDHAAARALASFRPVMTVDGATYARLAYELTTLPARRTLAFSAAWCAWGLFYYLNTPVSFYATRALYTSPAASAYEAAQWLFDWWVIGTVFYHTLHQLGVVSSILSKHTRIDLFAPQPIYLFARLTAVTAVGIVLMPYLWFAATSDVFASTSSLSVMGTSALLVNSALAGITFLLPLWGIHRLLVAEKGRRLASLGAQMDATIQDLQQRIAAGDRADIAQIKDSLDALVVAQATLDKTRTWPWPPGMLRGLAGAVLLPMLIWLITRLLESLIVF
jgi:hypothetical protein